MGVAELASFADKLICPETKQRLTPYTLAEAEQKIGAKLGAARKSQAARPVPHLTDGLTAVVLLREDLKCAYPCEANVPILLTPEQLVPGGVERKYDLHDPRFEEAYEEMDHYNLVAIEESKNILHSETYDCTKAVIEATPEQRESFPRPYKVWIDAVYDCVGQWEAYQHIAPIKGKRVLQMGGKGIHAVKFLLGGAAEAWVLTPMYGEVLAAQALAKLAGVEDRLHCIVAIAEELPLASGSFDVVYSGGCVHHMVTSLVFPEVARILRPGGKFVAVDPWRVPVLHTLGTKVLGKREPNVHCRPLNHERVSPLKTSFAQSSVYRYGALTRYPLLAMNKIGIHSRLGFAWPVSRADRAVCTVLPFLRVMGSGVSILATKS